MVIGNRPFQHRAQRSPRTGVPSGYRLPLRRAGAKDTMGMGSEFKPFLNERESGNPGRDFWSPPARLVVFALASTSILSLLFHFYGLGTMQAFTLAASLPALLALVLWAFLDRATGSQRLWRGVVVGGLAGLVAAFAYDAFRLPFVYAHSLGIERVVPPLQLFKVFPRFGALILGQPLEQSAYSPLTQCVGWVYHFSNALTFGIMYVALVGDSEKRHWAWAMLFAAGLELGMLFTPYPNFFGIALTPRFVVITLAAHLVFGAVMGLSALGLSRLLTPSAYR
jgi:hypothetical protein